LHVRSQFYDETNKKVLGKFKDETPHGTLSDFIGVRSKCYTIWTDKKIIKKLKGISKTVVQKNIELEDYKNCVLNNTEIYRNINAIRTEWQIIHYHKINLLYLIKTIKGYGTEQHHLLTDIEELNKLQNLFLKKDICELRKIYLWILIDII